MVGDFTFSRIPDIHFGCGKLGILSKILSEKELDSCLIITGKRSFTASLNWKSLQQGLSKNNISFFHESISDEPSPLLIDTITDIYRNKDIKAIVAVGGGSVLDAGKAVSAMMTEEGSIKEFLESVGNKKPAGTKLPFIAIPTTAGTGSETTKNAVITEVGKNGFKKSLRHDNYVPDIAIIDPELTITCPAKVTAACGMDAFTQLIESYVSTRSSLLTDTLALTGIYQVIENLQSAFSDPEDAEARTGMSYASMISGMTLANAGLGAVHGFASSVGGFFSIPHGIVCGSLMGEVIEINIEKMLREDVKNPAIKKYAKIGSLFDGSEKHRSKREYCQILIENINSLVQNFDIPKLSEFGINKADLDMIINNTGQKNNPVRLSDPELKTILSNRL